jgi:hypothetical protein
MLKVEIRIGKTFPISQFKSFQTFLSYMTGHVSCHIVQLFAICYLLLFLLLLLFFVKYLLVDTQNPPKIEEKKFSN